MTHWAWHILWGAVMTLPGIFAAHWALPFFLTLFLTAYGFAREGTQDHDRDPMLPFWQAFPWSGHKWLEVAGWPIGSLPVAIVGIWV